jgi:type IV secretion system protein VirB4
VWYLDVNQRSAAFVGGMGGEALTVGTPNCSLNPLLLPHTPANREFLALWLSTLIDPSGSQLNASSLAYFQSVIDRMLQLPAAQRTMAAMAAVVREADGLLASKLQPFAAGGAYGALFDNPQDNFKPSKLSAWQIGQWMNNPLTRIPLTGYLLHRLTGALNGTPTLLVLDEGFSILNTPLFSTRISGWCDYLSQQNAAAFIMTQEIELSASYPLAATLCAKAATMFAMPDKNPNAGYSMGLGFTPEDIAALSYIDGKAHHILQKRGPESVVIRVALNGLPQATLQALSGKAQAVVSPADMLANLMGTRKQAVG